MKAMKALCLLLLCSLPSYFFAQLAQPTPATERQEETTILRLSLVVPTIRLEQAVGGRFAVNGSFAVLPDMGGEFVNGRRESLVLGVMARIGIQPRFYWTQTKRKAQGMRTDYFSGGYLALPLAHTLGSSTYAAGALWGYQRTLGRLGYLDVGLGPGVSGGTDGMDVIFMGQLEVGFLLNEVFGTK